MNTVKINSKNTKLVAHRGLCGLESENTVAAFVAAGNRGYYGIETDVHKTADGKYVLIHDDKTGRVANKDLNVEKSRFSQLKELDLKDIDGKFSYSLKIPDLESYLRICKRYGAVAFIELKNLFDKASIKEIVSIVNTQGDIENTVFISFHFENLTILRRIEKNARLQYLCACIVDEKLIKSLKKYKMGLDIFHEYLTSDKVKLLHKNGIKVNCWTVNSKLEAEKYVNMGVDYITTNILEKAD